MFLTKATFLVSLIQAQVRLIARGQFTHPGTIGECKNNANWCTTLFPGACYNPNTEKTCCLFCRLNWIPVPGCPYGDEVEWCAARFCRDNAKKCCKTCPLFECKDRADWCRNLWTGWCYDYQTQTTCCKSCRQRLTGNPVCPFGNEAEWCAPEHCWATLQVLVNCCGSCPVAPTECKNNAPWCTSLFPGSCYISQTENICCQFCRQHLRSDLMCRYGNQYDWCKPESCSDMLTYTSRNCCETCPWTYV